MLAAATFLIKITKVANSGNFITPQAFLIGIFFLLPAFAMPMGWISGMIDISWYFFAGLLVLKIANEDYNSKLQKIIVIFTVFCLLLTKEVTLILLFSFTIGALLSRKKVLVYLLGIPALCVMFLFHNIQNFYALNLNRIPKLLKIFVHSGSSSPYITYILAFYLVSIFACSTYIVLIEKNWINYSLYCFALLSICLFAISSRPFELDAYYLLPSVFALTLIIGNSKLIMIKLKYQEFLILIMFLILFCVSAIIHYYPKWIGSASEFQSQRSTSFAQIVEEHGKEKLAICTPRDDVWAALGYGALISSYYPNVLIAKPGEKCNIQWSDSNQWVYQ
jgi:hypothetical protein